MNDHDITLAYMLTDKFLTKEKLIAASSLIKQGKKIEIPLHIREAIIESARSQRFESRLKGLGIRGWVMIIGFACLIFLIFCPYPYFQWASYRNTVSSYESFVRHFPTSGYSNLAHERIRQLREPDEWLQAKSENQIEMLRKYIQVYPDSKHLDEAKSMIAAIADSRWNSIAHSRSDIEIREFLNDYPETTKTSDAQNQLQSLYNDWDWVREQDQLEHYQRFIARYPNHPQKQWIDKRIIDLEVKEIAAGDYGEMPQPQPIHYGGSSVEIKIENKTGYELTVMYSGPTSKKVVISQDATLTVSLLPGEYKVAASMTSARVRNYFGADSMNGGQYSSTFYVGSSYSRF